MRISIALLSSVLAVLSSCAGGPTIADDGTMPFAAPMGETATPTAQAAPCLLTSQCLPLHWHDRFGAEWEGELEVSARDSTARVYLSYVQRPDGRWTGSMYYFGTFNNINLNTWINATDKSQTSAANGVANALIQRWTALRRNGMDGWDEFLAVLTSTRATLPRPDHASPVTL